VLTRRGGFSYTFLNEDLWRYTGRDASVDEFSVSTKSLSHPLVFEPGTSHGYGVGIQWVTVFIERFTGVTLERYFSEHIFSPLSLKSSAFFVSPKLRKSLVTLHRREEDGSLHPVEHVFAALLQEKEDDVVCSGEGGLVSTASDYAHKYSPSMVFTASGVEILAAILNDGVSPKTKARILKKETIDLMFKNQVPDFHRRFAGAGLVSPRNEFIAPWLAGGLPVAGTQGWGLNAGLTGKSEDSLTMASAPGVCNTFWSMDREKGVGCVLLSQIIPLGDPVVFGLWGQIQQIVYA
jgi:CubicO group peptidase (beta-lactamase class C family)